jgi:rhamnose transport system substrate-binding protein
MTPFLKSLFLKSMSCIACLFAACLFGCGETTPEKSDDGMITIAMLPKLTNIAYFDACHRGAEAAAKELGVKLIYDGPTEPSGSEQVKFIETWIRQGVDAICIAPNQPKAIAKSIERAKARGIKVLTWDTDAVDSGRLVMVNQVDDEKLAHLLIDDIARQMNEEGEWAIAIASLDAANLNNWRRHAEARAKEKYPNMKLVDTVVTEENTNIAQSKVATLLNVHPDLKGIIAFDSNSVPGAAAAIKQKGLAGKIALTGNTSPKPMVDYLREGVLESFYLWDPRELGDLTIRLAVRAVKGEPIEPGVTVGKHGKLTFSPNNDSVVILSDPIRFTKENIDQYDWGF